MQRPAPEGADGVLGSGVRQERGLDRLAVGDARLAGLDRLLERYFRLRDGVLEFGDPRPHPVCSRAGGEEDGGGPGQEGLKSHGVLLSSANEIYDGRLSEGAGEPSVCDKGEQGQTRWARHRTTGSLVRLAMRLPQL